MKRIDYIKKLYKNQMLDDMLVSFADEVSEEELRKQIEEAQKQQKELEEMGLDEDDFEEEDFEEETLETPETPEEPKPQEKPEDYVDMPNVKLDGFKYSPGEVVAKVCPVCGYENRPVYLHQCKNCARIYKSLEKAKAQIQNNPNYTFNEDEFLRAIADRFRYVDEQELRQIYHNKGITPLGQKDIYSVQPSERKKLEDIMDYRLNVKMRNGKPILHKKTGLPIPLENKKFFTTKEITEALHLSPEKFRELIAEHNSEVLQNLPEEAQKYVKRDESGELLPMSPKILEPYGFVAPAVLMGTGMADKRQLPTGDPSSPEEEEAQRGPARKTIDMAAWNWEKTAPAFGWDPEQKKFTGGWGKFLKEQFLPAIRQQKAENELKALKKMIERQQGIAQSKIEQIQQVLDQNLGLKTYYYFMKRPELDIEEFKEEHDDDLREHLGYVDKQERVRNLDKRLPPPVRKALENYDARKAPMTDEEYDGFVQAIANRLNTTVEKVQAHLELRDEAKLADDKEKEVDIMKFLKSNPEADRKWLEQKYENKRKRFEQGVYRKAIAAKQEAEQRIRELQEKLPVLMSAVQEYEIPEDFDLNMAVREFGRKPLVELDDPQEQQEYQELVEQENQENPLPTPKKEGSRLERIKKLAIIAELTDDDDEDLKKKDEIEIPEENEWMEGTPKPEKPTPFGVLKAPDPPPTPKSEYKPREKEVPTPSWEQKEKPQEIQKVVIRRTMMRINLPEKDARGRTVYIVDPITGETEESTREVMVPRLEHHLITLRTDAEGNVTHAKCEEIKGVSYQATGPLTDRPRYKDLLTQARTQVRQEAKENDIRLSKEEYKARVEEVYRRIVEEEHGDDVKPYVPTPTKEPYLPHTLSSATIVPCEACPRGTYIRDGEPLSGCKEIKVALADMEGKSLPSGYTVKNLSEIKRKEPRYSPKEERAIRRQKDVTDFFADDMELSMSLQPSDVEGPMPDSKKKKEAAEYQGKKVKLNDPVRNPSGSSKKFHVYVRDPKTKKIKKVQFGDPNMEIRRDDPERRKSFRARHKCEEAKDKTKARYWSCWQWRANQKVDN